MLPAKRLKLRQDPEEKKTQTRNVAILKGMESFTTELYECIMDQEKDSFVCSGLSVHLVLSMCAIGAQDNTAKEMLNGLHLDKDNLSSDFKNILDYFENVQNIELIIANRIVIDKSIVVKDTFKHDVREFFLTDVVDVDFVSQREKAVDDINDWCAEKTNNKIKQILSPGDIDSSTKMILTNAVYFNACWNDPFISQCTSDEPFFTDKDTTINVPTMHQSSSYMYKDLKRLRAECIAIPYRNRDYLFVIIKPKEIDGLKQLEIELQKVELNYDDRLGKKSSFKYDNLYLALPKFKMESSIGLNGYLEKMGMVEMFTGEADFKGISEEPVLEPPLHVDKVFQKAFIEVNEKGTEAAVVTYVRLRGGGPPQPPIEYRDFKVDRPFLYRIVNRKCNLTLFSGRVMRPTYN